MKLQQRLRRGAWAFSRDEVLFLPGQIWTNCTGLFYFSRIDYPGVGPEHAFLHDEKRAKYVPITDDEAVDAFEYLSRTEGIIPAIESAHAVAYAKKIVPKMSKDQIVIVTLSGRGDKDVAAIARYEGENLYD